RGIVKRVGATDLLKGHVLANLFYEPSTRTSSSFVAAMVRLGGSVIPIHGVQYSSVSKGESLPDTVRTLECYADVIVLRHPEVGASEVAARYASKPVISAGDGVGEHPTQGLLDIYTIHTELGTIDGLHVALVGDLKNGRTVHSLARLLRMYDTRLTFVSPGNLRLPSEVKEELLAAGRAVAETDTLEQVIETVDVLYVTRVQKERFSDLSEYEAVKDYYEITPELMRRAKARMVLMHPLPRVGEIHYDVDDDPRAAYFRQMENGMYIRMALLAAVLGKA
ncbi:MAG: aspartate carbamoyltransferase, partial [Anaerolineales bacterium]